MNRQKVRYNLKLKKEYLKKMDIQKQVKTQGKVFLITDYQNMLDLLVIIMMKMTKDYIILQ